MTAIQGSDQHCLYDMPMTELLNDGSTREERLRIDPDLFEDRELLLS